MMMMPGRIYLQCEGQRTFTGTSAANDADFLPRLDSQSDISEDISQAFTISRVQVPKYYLSLLGPAGPGVPTQLVASALGGEVYVLSYPLD